MSFSTDNGKTAGSPDFVAQLNIGTTTRHIGSDGHLTRQTSLSHNFSLALVLFGIQHIVFDVAHSQHFAEFFRDFDRSSTHQDRPTRLRKTFNFLNNGIVFLTCGAVYAVVHIFTRDRTVGRNNHNVEFVDVPKLTRLSFSRTGHTRQLVVHTEIVLQRDSSESLSSRLHFNTFLRLDSLVQTVRITASLHNTSGLFVNNLHLSVHNDVLVVFLEQRVGFQELVDRMDTFRLNRIVLEQFVFFRQFFLFREPHFFDIGDFSTDIRHNEELRVVGSARQRIDTLIGQFNRVMFFVDNKVKRIGSFRHITVVILHIVLFGLQQDGLDTIFTKELDERCILRKRLVGPEESERTLLLRLLIISRQQTFSIDQIIGSQFTLLSHQSLNARTKRLVLLVMSPRHRSGNNERSSRIVDQDRVDLVDNGIVVSPLNQFRHTGSHVIAQVVETELVIGTEGNVGHISLTAGVRVRLVLIDAVDAKTMELVQRPHPLRVTLSQVVVHRNNVYAVTGKRVQENRQSSHQGFTLTGSHFGNFTLVENHTTEQLALVVGHIPSNFRAARHPMVMVDSLIAIDCQEILASSRQFAIVVGSGNNHLTLRQTACSISNNSEDLRQFLIENNLQFVDLGFFKFVDLGVSFLTLFNLLPLDLSLQLVNLGSFLSHILLYFSTYVEGLLAKIIVRQALDGRVNHLDFFDVRHNEFSVFFSLITEQFR